MRPMSANDEDWGASIVTSSQTPAFRCISSKIIQVLPAKKSSSSSDVAPAAAKKNSTIIMGICRLEYENQLQNVEVAIVVVEIVSLQQVHCFSVDKTRF